MRQAEREGEPCLLCLGGVEEREVPHRDSDPAEVGLARVSGTHLCKRVSEMKRYRQHVVKNEANQNFMYVNDY